MKNPSEKSFQPWGASSQLAKREMRIRNAERKFEMQLVKDITNKSPEIPNDDCCLQEPYKHRCLTKDIRLDFVEDRSGKAAPSTHLPPHRPAPWDRWAGPAPHHLAAHSHPACSLPEQGRGGDALSCHRPFQDSISTIHLQKLQMILKGSWNINNHNKKGITHYKC